MKRVAEIIYIVESEREAFLKNAINMSDEEKKILWLCGVRKQQYFALNELIFMTFEYDGKDFASDMDKMANYLDGKGVLGSLEEKMFHQKKGQQPTGGPQLKDWVHC